MSKPSRTAEYTALIYEPNWSHHAFIAMLADDEWRELAVGISKGPMDLATKRALVGLMAYASHSLPGCRLVSMCDGRRKGTDVSRLVKVAIAEEGHKLPRVFAVNIGLSSDWQIVELRYEGPKLE